MNSQVLRNDASFGGGVALAEPGAVLHTEDTDGGSGEDDNTEAPDLAFVQDPDVLGEMDLPDNGALTCSWDERACRE